MCPDGPHLEVSEDLPRSPQQQAGQHPREVARQHAVQRLQARQEAEKGGHDRRVGQQGAENGINLTAQHLSSSIQNENDGTQ